MKLIYLIAGVLIVLGVFVGFGQTFISMATDEEHGYPTDVSPKFRNSFMNSTKSNLLIVDYQEMSYNTSNDLSTGKSKIYDEYYDVQGQIVNVIKPSFYFGLLDFAKSILLTTFLYLGIPKIVFGIIITILIFVVIFAAAKIILGREL